MTDPDLFTNLTVLSLEQALTLPFLTYRLRQEGMNIVRIEHPQRPDPNRFIGHDVLGEKKMNAYFLQNNLGKKAITLNLKEEEGRAMLARLIKELDVDIFATNQLPRSYGGLGIDEETLREVKPDLIWVGITGWGPEISEAAYDPVVQARSGLMELTGEADAPPNVVGVPLADLGAAEHAFGQVLKALYKKARTGQGSRIDISMFDSCTAWLPGQVMFAMNFDSYATRRGNTHEFFAPVSVFKTLDGHVYIAVGNDAQWDRMASLDEFAHLAKDGYKRNEGRIGDVDRLGDALTEVFLTKPNAYWLETFLAHNLPISQVNTLKDLVAEPLLCEKTVWAVDPVSGQRVDLPAAPVKTSFLKARDFQLEFPPRLGEHNDEIYGQTLGLTADDRADLTERGVI